MPKLPDVTTFGTRPTPRVTRGIQNVRAAGQAGTGLGTLGESLTSAAKVLEAGRLKREAAADKLATAQAKSQFLIADLEIRNSFEGDQEYQTYGSRYETVAKEACDTASEGLRDEIKSLFAASCESDIARGRVQVAKQARKMQVGIERAKGAEERDALKQAYLQEQDPEKRIEILNANRAAIEARVGLGFYTPEEGVKFGREDATDFPVDRIGTLPAQERLEVLTEGMTRAESGQPIFKKLDRPVDRVPIDKRVEMIEDAQEEIVAIRKEDRLAAKRAQDEQDRALKLAREETADEFTRRLYDPETPPLTYSDILDSNLKATQQQVYLNVLDKDGKTGQTNEVFYNEIFLKIGAGEIVSDQLAEVVLPFLGKGITGEDYTRLRSFAEKIHKERGGPALTDFLRMAKAQITKSNLFENDPVGDQRYYRFLSDFNLALEFRRAEGIPLANLLRPGDPNYLGPMINDYLRSQREQFRDQSDRLRALPLIPEPGGSPVFTPRLTGESDEDYIRRLGGQ